MKPRININPLSLLLFIVLQTGIMLELKSQEIVLEQLILKADSLFETGNYLNAKAFYQYAYKLDPKNQAVQEKLNESILRMRDQKGQREQYADFIIAADRYLKQNNLEAAKIKYQDALQLFGYENYPRQQIENINNKIQEEKQINEEYQQVINAADAYFAESDLANAQIEYQFALSLKPKEDYPKNKLRILKNLLENEALKLRLYSENIKIADSLLAVQNYQQATDYYKKAADLQPEKLYPLGKIRIASDLLNPIVEYNQLIEKADGFYMVRDFENAKIYYESAKRLKPTDDFATEMLNKTVSAIASKATTEQEDYENAIRAGNNYFSQKEYTEALLQFEFANRIKPDESYAREKINELNTILNSINSLEQINIQYTAAIEKADLLFEAQDYEKAISAYRLADSLKPQESYPDQKLDEIESALRLIEDKKSLENSYANSLLKAEGLFETENFSAAKSEFLYALTLKPDELAPKAKLALIDSILNQLKIQQSAAENYANTIAEADQMFEQQKYLQSQNSYRKALNYLPDKKYPQERIAEIDRIFNLQKEELEKAYELAISNAKNEIVKEQLQAAKTYLNEALTIKPGASYPIETLKQIDAQIAESKVRALEQYEPLLKEADNYFTQKEFDRALSFYTQASALLPNEIYPTSKINEIIQIVKNSTTKVLVDEPNILENNKLIQYNFESIPIADRKFSHILLKLKNSNSSKNFKLILNYGHGPQKNGGMIIRLTEDETAQYYLINIGSQYKWFSEDNNWISIQPEGDRVEISEISISKLN